MAKLDVATRKRIRQALKRIKVIDHGDIHVCDQCSAAIAIPGIKSLEKEKEKLRDTLKTYSREFEMDFSYPEGRTEWRHSTRVAYDMSAIDELIETGQIDADTAALIRRCKKTTEIDSMYIV